MKCISLWQPWATLIAIGAKKIETRHWKTDVRGRVAIHAAKRWTRDQKKLCCGGLTPLAGYQSSIYIHNAVYGAGLFNDGHLICPPLGAIVAVGDLVDCKFITSAMSPPAFPGDWETRSSMLPPPEPERSFGNYECGRYAWIFQNVRAIEPIPFVGKQGWFEVPEL